MLPNHLEGCSFEMMPQVFQLISDSCSRT